MKLQDIQVGDTVYLISDEKCDTIYEVVSIGKDGTIKLYHPIKLYAEAYAHELEPSRY